MSINKNIKDYLYNEYQYKDDVIIYLCNTNNTRNTSRIYSKIIYFLLSNGEPFSRKSIINIIKNFTLENNCYYFKTKKAFESSIDTALKKLKTDNKIENIEEGIYKICNSKTLFSFENETEIKNLAFNFLESLSLNERKEIYKNILEKFELKTYQENNYENTKYLIEKFKLLLKTL